VSGVFLRGFAFLFRLCFVFLCSFGFDCFFYSVVVWGCFGCFLLWYSFGGEWSLYAVFWVSYLVFAGCCFFFGCFCCVGFLFFLFRFSVLVVSFVFRLVVIVVVCCLALFCFFGWIIVWIVTFWFCLFCFFSVGLVGVWLCVFVLGCCVIGVVDLFAVFFWLFGVGLFGLWVWFGW